MREGNQNLATQCEKAKRTQPSSTKATIEVDLLIEGIDYSTVLSRATFEEFMRTLFKHLDDKLPVKDVTSCDLYRILGLVDGLVQSRRFYKMQKFGQEVGG